MKACAVIIAATLLAACGQTGPLHLPADAPSKESYLLKKRAEKPAATPAPAATPPATDPVPSNTPALSTPQ